MDDFELHVKDLQSCIQQAASCFGSGFLNPAAGNTDLCKELATKPAMADELNRQLLRFIYQLIFVFMTEERDILLLRKTEEMNEAEERKIEHAREKYISSFSTSRLRSSLDDEVTNKKSEYYDKLKVILYALRTGDENLALPELGSFFFSEDSTPLLDSLRMLDRDFISGLRKLCRFSRDERTYTMPWQSLRGTELGFAYESLLELRPSIDLEQGSFALLNSAGNERKSSGSFYTPTKLVNHLISTTIDPLLEEVKQRYEDSDLDSDVVKSEKIESILNLTVCDPASGSGNFLLAALERIAIELARIESGTITPSVDLIHRWKKGVASRCIYGVDLNRTAVELCKIAIWMDTYDGTLSLSFLDSHIRHGNSLLGYSIDNIGIVPREGIPKTWKSERKSNKEHNEHLHKDLIEAKKNELRIIERKIQDLEEIKPKENTLFGNERFIEAGLSVEGQAFSEKDNPSFKKEQFLAERSEIKEEMKRITSDFGNRNHHLSWSTHSMNSILGLIAEQQSVQDLKNEHKSIHLSEKPGDESLPPVNHLRQWSKELLDSIMAIWWWPEPSSGDKRKARKNSPLCTHEIEDYALWLAKQLGVADFLLENESNPRIKGDKARYKSIRNHTEKISQEQCFFHWEIEFPGVFSPTHPEISVGGFSVTIGNPPFVFARENLDSAEKGFLAWHFPETEYQANLYAYFIIQSLRYSKDGTIGLITPNNWMTLMTCGSLRRHILDYDVPHKGDDGAVKSNNGLLIISHPQGQFTGAAVDTLSLVMSSKSRLFFTIEAFGTIEGKLEESPFIFVTMQPDESKNELNLELVIDKSHINPTYAISPRAFIEPGAYDFLKYFSHPKFSVCLQDVALVKSGFVAYSVGRGVPKISKEMMKQRVYHSDSQVTPDWSKYLEGADVQRYHLAWSEGWVLYGANLAEPRVESLYTGERIVVRQIPNALPYCIHATLCPEEYFNDRNSMIVKCDNSPYDVLFILAVINSKLISRWFDLFFDKFQRNVFPQFKIGELALFPIPNLDLTTDEDKKIHDDIVVLTRQRLDCEAELQDEIELKLEELIAQAFKFEGIEEFEV